MNKKSKNQKIKELIRLKKGVTHTVNSLHFKLTGVKFGMQWHDQIMDVSKSTIRRTLDEMIRDKEIHAFYEYGHCYDEVQYHVIDDE